MIFYKNFANKLLYAAIKLLFMARIIKDNSKAITSAENHIDLSYSSSNWLISKPIDKNIVNI